MLIILLLVIHEALVDEQHVRHARVVCLTTQVERLTIQGQRALVVAGILGSQRQQVQRGQAPGAVADGTKQGEALLTALHGVCIIAQPNGEAAGAEQRPGTRRVRDLGHRRLALA